MVCRDPTVHALRLNPDLIQLIERLHRRLDVVRGHREGFPQLWEFHLGESGEQWH